MKGKNGDVILREKIYINEVSISKRSSCQIIYWALLVWIIFD